MYAGLLVRTLRPARVGQGGGHVGAAGLPVLLHRQARELVVLGLAFVVFAAVDEVHHFHRAVGAQPGQGPGVGVVAQLGWQLGQQALGGLGGVSLISQLIGTGLGISIALLGGLLVYGMLKASIGIRLSQEEEYYGADLSIHKIGATSHD